MILTRIQYDAIMMAIDNAKSEIEADTFIDPYAVYPRGYNNASLLQALNDVEDAIIDAYVSSLTTRHTYT
jgi:hypothetical protein